MTPAYRSASNHVVSPSTMPSRSVTLVQQRSMGMWGRNPVEGPPMNSHLTITVRMGTVEGFMFFFLYPPHNEVVGGYIGFTLSVRTQCIYPSMTYLCKRPLGLGFVQATGAH